jgi:acyl-CoA hydrolase/GNAT superfamily N-acetyltransferase
MRLLRRTRNLPERGPWQDRVVSVEDAVAAIAPGSNVYVGSACATPRTTVHALEDVALEHAGTRLVHFITDGLTVDIPSGTHFEHRAFFLSTDMAALLPKGRVEYVPVELDDLPGLLRSGRLHLDVTVVQVTPPEHGYVSLGVSVDAAPAAVEAADVVIAEVNPAMPWTTGNSVIPVDEVDYFVEVPAKVIEYQHPQVREVGERIARYIARIIDDGSTLHLGFGRVPSAMLSFLTERKDLGVHSDVITEPLADLIESGVVTGARKSVDRGAVVTSMAMGGRRLYDLLDRNPAIVFRPIDEVRNGLSRQERLVSVTQAFRVDLTGQVCADALGGVPYGGVATQPEFHRAAAVSPGGRAIVALGSVQPDGSSAIASRLLPGEGVTVPRHDVHWVVTEHGVAYLFGHSLRERAIALIEIAHPDHRKRLMAEAVELGLVPPSFRLRSRVSYPSEEERQVTLRDGSAVLVRPTRVADAALLQDLFFRLRPEDVRTRFFRNLRSLTRDMAEHLCNVGYEQEMALVAVTGEREAEQVVASAQYYVDSSTRLADVAYLVDPAWQGKGLGTALHQLLADYAARHGVRGFTADVLPENSPMLAVLRHSQGDIAQHTEDGVQELVIAFDKGKGA